MSKVIEYTGGAPIEEARQTKESFKKGGKVGKRSCGGKAEGGAAKMRLDKRARGGVLSAASNVKGRPGGKYDGSVDKSND